MIETGGRFNFTTEVDFPQTGHHVTIEQQFLGVDVFNYQRMAIHVTGTTPSLPFGSKIEIPDYEEEYVKTGFGIMIQAFRVEYFYEYYLTIYNYDLAINMLNSFLVDPVNGTSLTS